MSVEDAKRAADISCAEIVLSNHGGFQPDGLRMPFEQFDEMVQAVGGRIDVIRNSGVQRGRHILKALAPNTKAVGIDRS